MDADNIDELVHQSSRRVMAARTEYDWMAAAKRSALSNLSRLVHCQSNTPASIGLERCDVEDDQSCSNLSGGSSRLHLPEQPGRKKALGGDEDRTVDSTLSPVQTAVPSTALVAGLAASSRHSEDSSYSEDVDEMSEYSSSPCNGKKMRAICCVGFVLIAVAVGVSVPLAMRGPNKDESETTLSSTVGRPEQPLEHSFEDVDDEGYSPQSSTSVTVDEDTDTQSLILSPTSSPSGRTAIFSSSTSIQIASSAPTASPDSLVVAEPAYDSISLEYMIDDTIAIETTSPDEVAQSSGTIGDGADNQHSQESHSELPDYDQLTGPHSTNNETLYNEFESTNGEQQGLDEQEISEQYTEPRPSKSEEDPIGKESTGVVSEALDDASEDETIQGVDDASVNDSSKVESFDEASNAEVKEGTASTVGGTEEKVNEIFFMTPTGWQPILSPTSPQAAVDGDQVQTPPAFSRIPTSSLVTSNPTRAPRTSRPTTRFTSSSTSSNSSRKPSPETSRPTRKPRTHRPSPSPETLKPTRKPRTHRPTPSPVTPKPTKKPRTSRPTPRPTTRPTKMPTNQPVADIRPLPTFVGKSGNGNVIGHRLAIEIHTDKFSEETSWKVEYIGEESRSSKVVYSVKPETYQPHQRDFVELTLEPGKYKFTLTDEYGDGFCCNEGKGSYALYLNDEKLVSGGYFLQKLSFTILVGWQPGMSTRDQQWLEAHNTRRKDWHERHGKAYVPLKWSTSLAEDAQNWAEELLNECDDDGIRHEPNISQGENLAKNKGSANSGYSQLYPADNILRRWVEFEEFWGYPRNAHLTQALWRGSTYLGCGDSLKVNPINGSKCRM